MVNERPTVDFTELVAQAQEQLANIAAIQRQQAALTATASVADGMVQVSVNARGVDEYDVEDLGHDITDAAQQAAATVQRRASALMEPLMEHRAALPSLSEIISGAPDLRDFESQVPMRSTAPPNSPERLSLERDPTLDRKSVV